jgi:Kef-type K+ transport system membrane component KefB
MSEIQLRLLIFILLLIVGLAQLLGYLFARMRQPKVVGEILAGVLLGSAVVGQTAIGPEFAELVKQNMTVLNFIYWLGLLLLMFLSGAETQQLFTRSERREVGWLVGVGTGLPFALALGLGPWLVTPAIAGPNGNRASLIIILAIAVAVTSIPVISKIFADLKILNTRFARLVLGVAVLEDIVLWAALAIATAMAGRAALHAGEMTWHLSTTIIFFVLGLTLIPRAVKRFNKAEINILARTSPVAYVIAILLGYCAVAGALQVSMVFAAFLAGFAVVHKKRHLFDESLEAIRKVSFAIFIPIYFAIVGLKLDLIKGFSLAMLLVFLAGTCLIKVLSVSLGARLAGFRGLDVVNLALATNARGGPGIVLASVAYDAGIINATFYTTLVIAAVLTSQIAGAWLEYVMRKGWPLLAGEPVAAAPKEEVASSQ